MLTAFKSLQNWFVPRKISIDKTQVLGKGANETIVYKGSFAGRDVAVKKIPKKYFQLHDQEISLLKDGADSHENVITFFYNESDAKSHYIALELCETTLENFVKRPEDFQSLRERITQKEILQQTCLGLNHLHKLGIIHRDIKPQNILIFSGPSGVTKMKISDFGISKILLPGKFTTVVSRTVGTEGWFAPEILNEQITSTSSDIFSLGILFYYVLTSGHNPIQVITEILPHRKQYNFKHKFADLVKEKPSSDKSLALHLIKDMTKIDRRERPSIELVLAHPYFWNQHDCLNFILEIAKGLEKNGKVAKLLINELTKDDPEFLNGDWTKMVDKILMDEIQYNRKSVAANMYQLIRAIRNKWVHFSNTSLEVHAILGTTEESYMNYWTQKFPDLILHLYKFWNGEFARFLIKNKVPPKTSSIFDLPKTIQLKIFKFLDLNTKKAATLISKRFNEIITPSLKFKLTLVSAFNVEVIRNYESLAISQWDLTGLTLNHKQFEKLMWFYKPFVESVRSLEFQGCNLEISFWIPILNEFSSIEALSFSNVTFNKNQNEDNSKIVPCHLENLKSFRCFRVNENDIFVFLKLPTIIESLRCFDIENTLENKPKMVDSLYLQKNLKKLEFGSICEDAQKTKYVVPFSCQKSLYPNIISFIQDHKKLEKLTFNLDGFSSIETTQYLNHVLSLKTLRSLSIYCDLSTYEYFHRAKAVNENIEHLHWTNAFGWNINLASNLVKVFPNLKSLVLKEMVIKLSANGNSKNAKKRVFKKADMAAWKYLQHFHHIPDAIDNISQLVNTAPSKTFTIFDLPKSVQLKILKFLDLDTIKASTLLSKSFNEIITPILRLNLKSDIEFKISRKYESLNIDQWDFTEPSAKRSQKILSYLKSFVERVTSLELNVCKLDISYFILILNAFSNLSALKISCCKLSKKENQDFSKITPCNLQVLKYFHCFIVQEVDIFEFLKLPTTIESFCYFDLVSLPHNKQKVIKLLHLQTGLKQVEIGSYCEDLFDSIRSERKTIFSLNQFVMPFAINKLVHPKMIDFMKAQNKLENLKLNFEGFSIIEINQYLNHVLSLKSLRSLSIYCDLWAYEYFHNARIVNENIEHLHWTNAFGWNAKLASNLVKVFPNLKSLVLKEMVIKLSANGNSKNAKKRVFQKSDIAAWKYLQHFQYIPDEDDNISQLVNTAPSKTFTIFDLPKSVQLKIFKFLDLDTIKATTLLSKSFNEIIAPILALNLKSTLDFTISRNYEKLKIVEWDYTEPSAKRSMKIRSHLKPFVERVTSLELNVCKLDISYFILILNAFSNVSALKIGCSKLSKKENKDLSKITPCNLQGLKYFYCFIVQEVDIFEYLKLPTSIESFCYFDLVSSPHNKKNVVELLHLQTELKQVEIGSYSEGIFDTERGAVLSLKQFVMPFAINKLVHPKMIDFMKAQKRLEKLRLNFEGFSKIEITDFLNHVLSLKSLHTLSINCDSETYEYFHKFTTNIVNQSIENLDCTNNFSWSKEFAQNLVKTIPNIRSLVLRQMVKEMVGKKKYNNWRERVFKKCDMLPLEEWKNLQELCYIADTSNNLKWLKFENLKSFTGVISKVYESDLIEFLKNNPSIESVDFKSGQYNASSKSKENWINITLLFLNNLNDLKQFILVSKHSTFHKIQGIQDLLQMAGKLSKLNHYEIKEVVEAPGTNAEAIIHFKK